jgi:hypothetical protein
MQQSGQQSLVFRKNQIDATGQSNRTCRVIPWVGPHSGWGDFCYQQLS